MPTKPHRYPLRMTADDASAAAELRKLSGQSINDVLLLAMRKGMPLAREALLSKQGRLTNVDPLTAAAWAEIYADADEMSGVTGDQLRAAQVQEEPK